MYYNHNPARNSIKNRKIEKQLIYEGEVILTYRIAYPEIIYSNYLKGQEEFNTFNKRNALRMKKYAEGELFENAKATYEYNKQNGYPTMVYELVSNNEITYNNDWLVSLYTDEYIFLGGAHGNTVRTSQNWDLRKAEQIPLEHFFKGNPYYIIDILKQINKQIAKQIENGSNQYFDNYCQLVIENFKLENFYVVPNYIEVFFQQYDIAPYSSGIPTFRIRV